MERSGGRGGGDPGAHASRFRFGLRARLATVTGVPVYCDAGVALGIGRRAGRASIIVNRGASEREGARFSARLLRLARVLP